MREQTITAKRMRRRALRSAALALALSGLFAASAAAAIDVNTTADDYLANPSTCSLREAIYAANTNAAQNGCTTGTAGTDTINVPDGDYNLTKPGAGENLDATGDLDLPSGGPVVIQHTGSGKAIVDGGGLDRVIDNDVNLKIVGLTIRNGRLSTNAEGGGGIQNN